MLADSGRGRCIVALIILCQSVKVLVLVEDVAGADGAATDT